MRRALAVPIALLLLGSRSAVFAQQRYEPVLPNHISLLGNHELRFYGTERPRFSSLSGVAQQSPPSTARLVAGGLIGGAAGLAIGGLAGAVIGGSNSDAEEEWVDAVWGSVIGATVAESLGLATGVHLSNRRKGNLPFSVLASLAIGGAGLAVLIENQDPPIAPVVLIATPLAQLAAAIGIERATRK